jgi:hypothetical protein
MKSGYWDDGMMEGWGRNPEIKNPSFGGKHESETN